MAYGGFEIPPRLIVVKQLGCPSCAEAEPHLLAFGRKYVGRILIISSYSRGVLDWAPSATPAYALVRDGRIVRRWIGTMTLAELEKWVWRTKDEVDGEGEEEGEEEETEEENAS